MVGGRERRGEGKGNEREEAFLEVVALTVVALGYPPWEAKGGGGVQR